MKKLLNGLFACSMLNNVLTMELPTKVDVERAVQVRKKLSFEDFERLNDQLYEVVARLGPDAYTPAKELLDRGADPFIKFDDYVGRRSRPQLSSPSRIVFLPELQEIRPPARPNLNILFLSHKITGLLSAYQAHYFNVGGRYVFPITLANDLNILQTLVRSGTKIRHSAITYLACLNQADLRTTVWALLHGANPNLASEKYIDYSPLCAAMVSHRLSNIIALLQYGASLDAENNGFSRSLLRTAEIYWHEARQDEQKLTQAQYELLKTLSSQLREDKQLFEQTGKHFDDTKLLNPHVVYTRAQYEAFGISPESARLIQKATQQVNDEVVRCVEDDLAYNKQNLAQFVLDREIGRIGRRRRNFQP